MAGHFLPHSGQSGPSQPNTMTSHHETVLSPCRAPNRPNAPHIPVLPLPRHDPPATSGSATRGSPANAQFAVGGALCSKTSSTASAMRMKPLSEQLRSLRTQVSHLAADNQALHDKNAELLSKLYEVQQQWSSPEPRMTELNADVRKIHEQSKTENQGEIHDQSNTRDTCDTSAPFNGDIVSSEDIVESGTHNDAGPAISGSGVDLSAPPKSPPGVPVTSSPPPSPILEQATAHRTLLGDEKGQKEEAISSLSAKRDESEVPSGAEMELFENFMHWFKHERHRTDFPDSSPQPGAVSQSACEPGFPCDPPSVNMPQLTSVPDVALSNLMCPASAAALQKAIESISVTVENLQTNADECWERIEKRNAEYCKNVEDTIERLASVVERSLSCNPRISQENSTGHNEESTGQQKSQEPNSFSELNDVIDQLEHSIEEFSASLPGWSAKAAPIVDIDNLDGTVSGSPAFENRLDSPQPLEQLPSDTDSRALPSNHVVAPASSDSKLPPESQFWLNEPRYENEGQQSEQLGDISEGDFENLSVHPSPGGVTAPQWGVGQKSPTNEGSSSDTLMGRNSMFSGSNGVVSGSTPGVKVNAPDSINDGAGFFGDGWSVTESSTSSLGPIFGAQAAPVSEGASAQRLDDGGECHASENGHPSVNGEFKSLPGEPPAEHYDQGLEAATGNFGGNGTTTSSSAQQVHSSINKLDHPSNQVTSSGGNLGTQRSLPFDDGNSFFDELANNTAPSFPSNGMFRPPLQITEEPEAPSLHSKIITDITPTLLFANPRTTNQVRSPPVTIPQRANYAPFTLNMRDIDQSESGRTETNSPEILPASMPPLGELPDGEAACRILPPTNENVVNGGPRRYSTQYNENRKLQDLFA